VLSTRISATEEDVRGLRKGEGFITRHRATIEGEHP
jgi:hypothetical protein